MHIIYQRQIKIALISEIRYKGCDRKKTEEKKIPFTFEKLLSTFGITGTETKCKKYIVLHVNSLKSNLGHLLLEVSFSPLHIISVSCL